MSTQDDVLHNGMKIAVDLLQKCKSEVGRVSPKVAAVAIEADEIIQTAFRGEYEPGDHAEFTILEKKLKNRDVKDVLLITTLEPCTVRGASKIPCAERI